MDGISEPAEVDDGPTKGVLAFRPVIHGYQYVPASPPLPCLSFQLWLRLWHYRYQNRQLDVSPAVLFPILHNRFHYLRTKTRELRTTRWPFFVSEKIGFFFLFFIFFFVFVFVKSSGVLEKVEMIGGGLLLLCHLPKHFRSVFKFLAKTAFFSSSLALGLLTVF